MNTRKPLTRLVLLASLTLLAACSHEYNSGAGEEMQEMPASVSARETSDPAAMLAYEHHIGIKLPAEQISERLTAAREACANAKFGECHILKIHQSQSISSLTVRVLPAGVEPLIALAGEAGNITSRYTSAEDLSQAVKDNRQQQAQLAAYAKRMEEISRRPNITVADLMTLAREQADVQQQLDELSQAAAQQQRRIDTNLLTLNFSEVNADSTWRDFTGSLGDLLLRSSTDALSVLAYGLPFLLLLFPVALLWRWAWRRFVSRKAKAAP